MTERPTSPDLQDATNRFSGLVYKLARVYASPAPFEDRVNEGFLALFIAAKKHGSFYSSSMPFISVRGVLLNHGLLERHAGMIVPAKAYYEAVKRKKTSSQSVEPLLNLEPRYLEEAHPNDEGDLHWDEVFVSQDTPDPERTLEQKELREQIWTAMQECLTDREIMVIRMRYNPSNEPEGECLGTTDIARNLGVTREAIEKCLKRARYKLGKYLK